MPSHSNRTGENLVLAALTIGGIYMGWEYGPFISFLLGLVGVGISLQITGRGNGGMKNWEE